MITVNSRLILPNVNMKLSCVVDVKVLMTGDVLIVPMNSILFWVNTKCTAMFA